MKNTRIAIIGLGYVGLPLALALAKKFPKTIGYDNNAEKVGALRRGIDPTNEGNEAEIAVTNLSFESDPRVLEACNFFIVAVPTPIDAFKKPNLEALLSSSKMIGERMPRGSTIVFESTVYPGVTEEVCAPALERASGLKSGIEFKIGYSPERINPGDKEHSLERVIKVVSGQDEETLELVANVYAAVVPAGIHRAPSIKVAEAAKVIENTQRDVNIALMNELALVFDRLGISTRDVLEAAKTKWNFLNFSPGLVGGHCIGVDPYYLTSRAVAAGYHPQVILSGRQVNDSMGSWVAHKAVKLIIQAGLSMKGARIGILGLTFKENVADARNSRVPDIYEELRQLGLNPLVHDPLVHEDEAYAEYRIPITKLEEFHELDALILAVPHKQYLNMPSQELISMIKPSGVVVDVKSCLNRAQVPTTVTYFGV